MELHVRTPLLCCHVVCVSDFGFGTQFQMRGSKKGKHSLAFTCESDISRLDAGPACEALLALMHRCHDSVVMSRYTSSETAWEAGGKNLLKGHAGPEATHAAGGGQVDGWQ